MRFKLDKGQLMIHLGDLLDGLSSEEKHEIASHLVWDEEIFKEVVESIATDTVVTSSFNLQIYGARLRLVELLPQMQREIVRSLLYELRQANEKARACRAWAWQLYHLLPSENRPRLPSYVMTPWPTEEEVGARAMGEVRSE